MSGQSITEQAARFRAHFDLARFEQWMRDAQPGAQVTYGWGNGAAAAAPEGVAAAVSAWAGHGLVHPCQRRTGDFDLPFQYLMQRTGKALPPRFPQLPAADHFGLSMTPAAIAQRDWRARQGKAVAV